MFTVHQYPEAKTHMGRLDYGEDIIQQLEAYCHEQNITTGWVQLMGALEKATLAYFDQKERRYVSTPFEGEFEIINGTGNISMRNHKPMAHVHLLIADSSMQCRAGHLMPGTSKIFACEFIITELSGNEPLERTPDQITSLPLWKR